MEIDDGEKKKRGACEVVKRAMVVSWGDDVAQARIAGEPKQELEAEPGRELAEGGQARDFAPQTKHDRDSHPSKPHAPSSSKHHVGAVCAPLTTPPK
jgi:hypothetical protein